MITEQQQEQAALCALGLLSAEEQERFATEVRTNSELREFLWSLQRTTDSLALAGPMTTPAAELKTKVLQRIRTSSARQTPDPGPQLEAGLLSAKATKPQAGNNCRCRAHGSNFFPSSQAAVTRFCLANWTRGCATRPIPTPVPRIFIS